MDIDLVGEYEALLPDLGRFAELGVGRLAELLAVDALEPVIPLQARVKTLPSLLGKIDRKGRTLSKLTDVPDLVGFRLIVAYRRELERACQIVEEAFHVVERAAPALGVAPDRFGYSSIHLAVRPPDDWLREDGARLQQGLRGEVQVRTLAQHLWAYVSHDLQYKVESEIPDELQRTVNRSAALLELVDLEFERVLLEREDFLAAAEVVKSSIDLTTSNVAQVLDALWPPTHRQQEEPYGFLVAELKQRRIRDCDELARVIRRHRPRVLDYAARYAQRFLRNIEKHGVQGGTLKVQRPSRQSTSTGITPEMIARLRQGIFFGHVALTATALALEFDSRDLDAELLD
jgi:putative GTP pyrophosphokinase